MHFTPVNIKKYFRDGLYVFKFSIHVQNVVTFMLPLEMVNTNDLGGNESSHSGSFLFSLNIIAGGILSPQALNIAKRLLEVLRTSRL